MKKRLLFMGILLSAIIAAADRAMPDAPSGEVHVRDVRDPLVEYVIARPDDAPELGAPGRSEASADAPVADDADAWNLILVNRWNSIAKNPDVALTEIGGGHAIDARAYDDFVAMFDAARAEGLSPMVCSSYRTWERQEELHANKVNDYIAQGYAQADAEREASRWVAAPGTSEHQTGLALDIVSVDYQLLDEGQERTAEQRWLMENAHKYGFILRYPADKSDITGIYYEPWHYRYVGREAAEEIYTRGICLEEYLAG